ncbi:MAG TPA: class F sortase [Nocardioidaceae bacterium]|nr:class F sortase [Nocardioidaceae bacterium]
MTEDGRRRARTIASLVAAVLGVVGLVAVGSALLSQQPAPPAPPQTAGDASTGQAAGPPTSSSSDEPTPSTSSKPTPSVSDEPRERREQPPQKPATQTQTPLELDYSEPVRLDIPSLDVSTTMEDLGLSHDGTMEVPVDPDKAGWFTPSVPPGVVGASVIAGHVTWDQEPVVFFRLGELRSGDEVEVLRADGQTAVFTVQRIGQFAKSEFPTSQVYDRPSRPGLRLITCGGAYDEVNNRYLDNVVVWASLTDVRPAAA